VALVETCVQLPIVFTAKSGHTYLQFLLRKQPHHSTQSRLTQVTGDGWVKLPIQSFNQLRQTLLQGWMNEWCLVDMPMQKLVKASMNMQGIQIKKIVIVEFWNLI
jgi:hypothetical protein